MAGQSQGQQQPQRTPKQPSMPLPSTPAAAQPEGSEGEGVVGRQLDYKPLPFAPELLEVPDVPVDVLPGYETPAQQAAWSDEDYVEAPIPILKAQTLPEPMAEARPYDPVPHFRTITVPTGVDGQVTETLPYRRIVTVLAIGDAARATFAFRSRYTGESMLVVTAGDLPFDLSVFPDQELFVLHETGVDQEMSFIIEPRGEGR